jgi:hypothetical protein
MTIRSINICDLNRQAAEPNGRLPEQAEDSYMEAGFQALAVTPRCGEREESVKRRDGVHGRGLKSLTELMGGAGILPV